MNVHAPVPAQIDIRGGVTAIIAEILGCPASSVTPDATIRDYLGAKTNDRIEIALEIERDFSIVICGPAYLECSTVGDLVSFVETRLRQMGKLS